VSRPKVFITRMIAKEALDKIARVAETEVWLGELPPTYEVLLTKAKNVDGMLVMLTDKIDATLISVAPRLRVISNLAVGYDNIDIEEAAKRGISVGNTPGVLTKTTADFAFALLMAAARRVVEADTYTRNGKWHTWGPGVLLGQDVHHAVLGIIGLGRIGAEVAKRAIGFGMKVIYCDEFRQSVEREKELNIEFVPKLSSLLSESDFVTVHVPLTGKTRHLIGAAEFATMKSTAVFVNTSRGAIVDQKALYEALKSKRIFAAALDVTEVEPISSDDPLMSLDNVILTPHIASGSYITRSKMATMAADNLIAGLEGKALPHSVNLPSKR